jgi:SagB-type dehydrogenase family enzyme
MNETTRYEMLRQREMMKGYGAGDIGAEPTDQAQKLPFPAPLKEASVKAENIIQLPLDFEQSIPKADFFTLLQGRESVRQYAEEPLTLTELSFLLWATQGVRRYAGKYNQVTFRNVPSAGSRHPFETYLFIHRVEGLAPAVYHYLPACHGLERWDEASADPDEFAEALCGQQFAASSAVTFVWSVLPYRTEWRYGRKAHKYMLIDAGHMCENLYLAGEAIGCGTCAIGAYDQDLLDELLGFISGPSGENACEFAVYAAAVGKKK